MDTEKRWYFSQNQNEFGCVVRGSPAFFTPKPMIWKRTRLSTNCRHPTRQDVLNIHPQNCFNCSITVHYFIGLASIISYGRTRLSKTIKTDIRYRNKHTVSIIIKHKNHTNITMLLILKLYRIVSSNLYYCVFWIYGELEINFSYICMWYSLFIAILSEISFTTSSVQHS